MLLSSTVDDMLAEGALVSRSPLDELRVFLLPYVWDARNVLDDVSGIDSSEEAFFLPLVVAEVGSVSNDSPNSCSKISRSRCLALSDTRGLLIAARRPRSRFPGSVIILVFVVCWDSRLLAEGLRQIPPLAILYVYMSANS